MRKLTVQRSSNLHRWLMLTLVQLLCVAAMAQVKVSGKVTDKSGQGIPGISVTVRNTTFGGYTDAAGVYNFSANLKSGNYDLDFSGIGYQANAQKLRVTNDGSYTINASLGNDALGLDEVVVTGTSAGTTRKQLGSYVSTVKADQLTKGATGNAIAALQGKTAGAQIIQNSGDPAGGMSVRLRGVSTIFGSSEPLYIVDGIIVSNATTRVTNTQGNYDGERFVGTIGQNRMADINPADIERVEVLNGAAAAAIYGSRANAGVVQIFTKRGSSGAPVVSFSTNVMVNSLRKKVEVNRAPVKFGGSPDVSTQDILVTTLTTTSPVTRYDYQDYIFQTGVGTDNNVSVAGGQNKTKYFISGSYFYNEGIVKNTDFKRFSFRSNIDQAIGEKINVGLNLNYINSAANEKPDGNSFYSPMNSVTIIGNFHDIWTRDALGNVRVVGERQRLNPVSVIEDIKQRQETNRILAGMNFKYRPIKNLSLDYNLGIDNYTQNGQTFIPPFAYPVNTAFFGGGATLDPTLNGYASTASSTLFQINHEINGTYNANITSDLTSTTQVGYSLQYEKQSYLLNHGRGLAPFVETVGGASTILPGADQRGEYSLWGGYIQQNFKYKNHLFVTGAVRRDGSSIFAPSQRNQTYLKGSVSYVPSSTQYWENLGLNSWWDLLKFRLAYGQSGNLTAIGPYARFNSYSSNAFLGRSAFQSRSNSANTDMRPERQEELEFGVDMGFLGNRIGLQLNVYNKKLKDLLFDRVVAPTTGFTGRLDNFGSMENKGFEVVLNLAPIRNKDWRWDITAIYNQNRNKIINLGAPLTLLSTNAGAPVALLQGQPVGVFYGTFFARNGNGDQIKNSTGIPLTERGTQDPNNPANYTVLRDANGLPQTTPPSVVLRKIIGDPNPDWTGSLVSDLGYKRLNFRVQLDAVQGVDVFNADWRTRQGVGNGKEAEKEHLGQLPRGYISGVYGIEEWRIDDGSFVKLREVSLSYQFGRICKVFSSLTVQASGRNLISWDNYKGYDPEVNAGGQSTLLRGIDFGAVPIPRTFSLGVQAKF